MEINKIKVTVTLLPCQFVAQNRWNMKFCGETRQLMSNNVEFYTESIPNLMNKIDMDEIASINIHWDRRFYLDGHGEKVYDLL